MAELVVQDLQTRSTYTKFSMVRFGNVLGSSSSVLPLFKQQIRRGGDMGKPVKILDIARRIIELSGRTVRENGIGDISIEMIGMRPGEKLHEELLIDDDSLCATPHEKILRAEEVMLSEIEIVATLRDLRDVLEQGNVKQLRLLLQKRVDGYDPSQQFLAT
jgi:FlaA1/EpsC-like NDP-sugar epimerase